jgi:hypothetical protein
MQPLLHYLRAEDTVCLLAVPCFIDCSVLECDGKVVEEHGECQMLRYSRFMPEDR